MKDPFETLLEKDHASLGRLLIDLDAKLSGPDAAAAFELLDRFWARLALHIRAEHLHLFPALANVPASLFTGRGDLPTSEELQSTLARLRSDHDFFLKELASVIREMREIAGGQPAQPRNVEDRRRRLAAVANRLEAHNRLEEERLYTWPTLLLGEPELAALRTGIAHELENLPPRFAKDNH